MSHIICITGGTESTIGLMRRTTWWQVFLKTAGKLNGSLSLTGIRTNVQAAFGRNIGLESEKLFPDTWQADLVEIKKNHCEVTGLQEMEVVRAGFALDMSFTDEDKTVSIWALRLL